MNTHGIAVKLARRNHFVPIPRAIQSAVIPNAIPNAQVQPATPRVRAASPQHSIIVTTAKKPGRSRPLVKSGPKYITPKTSDHDLILIRNIHDIGRGRVLVIIANGPSLLEIDTTSLKTEPGIDIMSINRPDDRVWPTKYWTFFDVPVLQRHRDLWSNYQGTIFNSTAIRERRPNTIAMTHLAGFGFSRDLAKGIYIGHSSTFAAIQIGFWLNYAKIFILGIDMAEVAGKLHFYGHNPDVDAQARKKRFDTEAMFYERAAAMLTVADRDRVVFCSSYNEYKFVDQFKRLDHKVAVYEIKDYIRTVMANEMMETTNDQKHH